MMFALRQLRSGKWLGTQIGKEICSVVSEATIEKLSQEKQNEGFRPSVPFVACLSSCMMSPSLYARRFNGLESSKQVFNSMFWPVLSTEYERLTPEIDVYLCSAKEHHSGTAKKTRLGPLSSSRELGRALEPDSLHVFAIDFVSESCWDFA